MKFKYFLFLEIFISIIDCSVLLKLIETPTVPESKKLEVKFTRNGGPMSISTEYPLNEVVTNFPAYSVNSVMIKDSRKQAKQAVNSSPFIESDPPVLYPPSEPIVIEKEYIVKNIETVITPKEPEVSEPQLPQLPQYAELNQSLAEIIKSMQGHIDQFSSVKDSENAQVYSNLKTLETDLEKALDESKMQTPIQMESRTVKSIMSYLEHLEYMHNVKQGKTMKDKPELPEWYYKPEEPADILSDDFLQSDQTKLRIVELKGQIDVISEQLESYRQSGKQLDKINDLQDKKYDLNNRIERLELGMPETDEELQDLESLEAKETQLRDAGAEDSIIAQVEHMEGEVIMENDLVQEQTAGAQISRLKNRLLQIQSDLSVVSNNVSAQTEVQHLQAEESDIIRQEAEIISETDVNRLNELNAELNRINQKEALLRTQPNTTEQIDEFEHTKEAIITKEEQIKHQMKEPTPQAVEEILHDFADSPKFQAVFHAHPVTVSDERYNPIYHEESKVHSKIDIDGQIHVVDNKKQIDHPNSQSDYEDIKDAIEAQEMALPLETHQPASEEYTVNDQNRHPMLDLLKEPLDLKFSQIDNYKKFDHLIQQLNTLSAIYEISFSSMPSTSQLPDYATVDLQANIKLLQKLRTANEVFSKYKSNIDDEVEYLAEELTDLNLSFEGMLGFYDLRDEYDETRTNESNSNIEYLDKHIKLNSEANVYKTDINELARDSNTLNSLHKLLSIQLDSIVMKKTDTGIDEVKKVDGVIGTIKKINIVRKEIDNIIKEMKAIAAKVIVERKKVESMIDDLSLVSKGVRAAIESGVGDSGVNIYVTGFVTLLITVVAAY